MFLLRLIFFPFILLALSTAVVEFMLADSDWDYWKKHHQAFLNLLPWAKYK